MSSISQKIKSIRISKKISINEAANELKISTFVLEQIENDKHEIDSNIIFYIGHIRSYCNFLDIDADKVIKQFKKEISFKKNDITKQIVKPSFENHFLKFQKFFPITLIFFVFFSFYILFIKENNKTLDYALIPDLPENYIPIVEKENLNINKKIKSTNAEIVIKNNFASAEASNEPPNSLNDSTITLKIMNSTWLQLRDESNNIILSKLMEKNDEYSYKMNLNYNITAGNGGNILVIIDRDVSVLVIV